MSRVLNFESNKCFVDMDLMWIYTIIHAYRYKKSTLLIKFLGPIKIVHLL